MVYELYNENSGICRFHRKWSEVIVDEIISAHYRFPVNYKAHQFELAKRIYEFNGAAVVQMGERARFSTWSGTISKRPDETATSRMPSFRAWVERFRADKSSGAARAYWDELRAGIAEAFAARRSDQRPTRTWPRSEDGCDGEKVTCEMGIGV